MWSFTEWNNCKKNIHSSENGMKWWSILPTHPQYRMKNCQFFEKPLNDATCHVSSCVRIHSCVTMTWEDMCLSVQTQSIYRKAHDITVCSIWQILLLSESCTLGCYNQKSDWTSARLCLCSENTKRVSQCPFSVLPFQNESKITLVNDFCHKKCWMWLLCNFLCWIQKCNQNFSVTHMFCLTTYFKYWSLRF
jgi:hypothetical protein